MFLSSLKNLGTLSLTVVAAVMLSACASDSSKLPPDLNSLKTGPKGKFPLFEAKDWARTFAWRFCNRNYDLFHL